MPDLAGEKTLGYQTARTDFSKVETLRLDAAYRLAHLPLVAPGHPDVISSADGKPYRMGKRPEAFSVVIPIDGAALASSPGYVAMENALQQSSFADEIDWALLPRRQHVLHATIAGGMSADPIAPVLSQFRSFEAELRGLFSGNINLGRLYLRLYPETRECGNAITEIQHALGKPATALYLAGLFNLNDHLPQAKTQELAELIDRFWSCLLVKFRVDTLWLLGTSDDLALESRIVERIALR
ncbi:MAG TPA: hypothetical protein PKW21_11085 [Rhabdaerophilum sp.]|nr:hypothetical protein [Rhabdaerophilum sp.]